MAFQKSLKPFHATGETITINLATTNSISISGFNYKVLVYLDGLLKPITSYEN